MLKNAGSSDQRVQERLHQDSVFMILEVRDGDADSFSHGIHHR